MSAFDASTRLLWWLMLLSTTGIILRDIGSAMLPRGNDRKEAKVQMKGITTTEDDVSAMAERILTLLHRPASFRALQREVAQTIVHAALAANGYQSWGLSELKPELVSRILHDQELIMFVENYLPSVSSGGLSFSGGTMLAEFEKTLRALEKAESELA